MLGQHGRGVTKALFTKPALGMARIGITPNMLTATGTVLCVLGAVLTLAAGDFVVGPLMMACLLVADSFDGILARATGTSSRFGAFLDSTMDRLADGAVFGSLTFWAATAMPAGTLRTITLVAGLASITLAAAVPYARARAESIGATASVGIAERTDRLVVGLVAAFAVGLGAPAWVLTAGLAVVAVGSLVTVVQRVAVVRGQVLTSASDADARPGQ